MKKLTVFLAAALIACASYAEIKMPKIFSDNMVLQQGQKVKIWGMAAPGAKVDVEFAKQKQSAKVGSDGKWSVVLNPLKMSVNGETMKISESGAEPMLINNVVVGEVWVTGGQSNMAFGLGGAEGAAEIIARAEYPLLRFFTQPACITSEKPEFDCAEGSKWQVCTPKIAGSISAVSFLFAEKIMKDLKMPVGIVTTAMSGTPMVAWIAPDYIETSELYAKRMEHFKKEQAKWDYAKAMEKWNKGRADHAEAAKKAKEEGTKAPAMHFQYTELHKPWKDSPDAFRSPAVLYNGKVAPVAGYGARGFVWYQGENDSGGVSQETFDLMLEGLIDCWRKKWTNDDMEFLFAQLPSFNNKSWPDIRNKQAMVAKRMKNVGMAVTIDTGDEKDVHPKDKVPVGDRLANIALKEVYKRGINAFGPTFKSAEFKKGTAIVSFDMDGSKFKLPQGDITGFELFDGKAWMPAKASVKGDVVTVSANTIKDINGVRYAYIPWAKPEVNLFNENGLPTAPFIFEAKK